MNKAETTRLMVLGKAFELIYRKGYQATSIDDIIATTNVTKGAFYYHFKNKDEMGLAIINEILKPALAKNLIQPFQSGSDPLDAIYHSVHGMLMTDSFMKVEYGCPVSNFTQEMSPWNKNFSKALNTIVSQWQQTMTSAINNGKKAGLVRMDVKAAQVTAFVMSGYWGIRNFGKLANSKDVYLPYLKELKIYLAGLK